MVPKSLSFRKVSFAIATDRDDFNFRSPIVALNETASWQEHECTDYYEPRQAAVHIPSLSAYTTTSSECIDPAEV